MFLAGLAVFTAASLACGLSASPWLLIAARFVQGIGGAMVSAVSLGMIVTLYPGRRERVKAIGAFSFVGAAGASIGLVIGGVLTEALSWHWIFFVNVPIGAVAAAAAAALLTQDRAQDRPAGADALGAVLVTAGLMTGIDAIVETARYGWVSAHTLGFSAAAAGLLAGFAARQAKAAAPLLPLRIFAARNVAGANLAQVLVIAAAFGFQVLVTLYLQRVLGYGPAAAGLGLLPTAALIGAVSLGLAARLATRFGERAILLTGLTLIAVALALLTQVPAHGSYALHVLPALLLFGAGGGLTLPALAALGMSGATPSDAGIASGLFNTAQQAGAALGLAVLSTLAAVRASHLQASGTDIQAALTGGYRLAFGVGAGLSAAAAAVAATMLRPMAPAKSAGARPGPREDGSQTSARRAA